ncbi:MAG: hypothetical protein ABI254_10280, partial [Chthoniobacterales bacterium]
MSELNGWLQQPYALNEDTEISRYGHHFSHLFSVDQKLAMGAVINALSLAVGGCIRVSGSRWSARASSLQTTFISDDSVEGKCLFQYMGRTIVECAQEVIGASPYDTPESIEKNLNACARTANAFLSLYNSLPAHERLGVLRNNKAEEVKKKCFLAAIQYERWRAKKQVFRFMDFITPDIIENVSMEEGDYNLSSFSPDGSALVNLGNLDADTRKLVLEFMHSGFTGEAFKGKNPQPIFPAISVLWIADRTHFNEVNIDEFLNWFPGMLLLGAHEDVGSTENSSSLVEKPQWEELMKILLKDYRGTSVEYTLKLSPEGDKELWNFTRSTKSLPEIKKSFPGLLERASENVLKIAALCCFFNGPNSSNTISLEEVSFAIEQFKYMASHHITTVNFLRKVTQSSKATAQLHVVVERIVAKLTINGPSSRRELSKSFHKVDVSIFDQAIAAAVNKGAVQVVDGKLLLANDPLKLPSA